MPREKRHFLSLATLVSSSLLDVQIEEFSMLGQPWLRQGSPLESRVALQGSEQTPTERTPGGGVPL